jgi:hypothetical protein
MAKVCSYGEETQNLSNTYGRSTWLGGMTEGRLSCKIPSLERFSQNWPRGQTGQSVWQVVVHTITEGLSVELKSLEQLSQLLGCSAQSDA